MSHVPIPAELKLQPDIWMADTIYEYNELGEQIRSGLDVNDSGSLELSSVDRISESETKYTYLDNAWWKEQIQKSYPVDNDDTPLTLSTRRTMVSGSGCSCQAGEGVSIDVFSNITVQTMSIDPDARQVTKSIDYYDSTNDQIVVTVNGLQQTVLSRTGLETRYLYDALGRNTGTVLPRTGTNTTHYNTQGRIDYTEDPAGNRTTHTYEQQTGRRIEVTDALTNTTYSAYDIQGRITNTWGATYPVAYAYPDFRRQQRKSAFFAVVATLFPRK